MKTFEKIFDYDNLSEEELRLRKEDLEKILDSNKDITPNQADQLAKIRAALKRIEYCRYPGTLW